MYMISIIRVEESEGQLSGPSPLHAVASRKHSVSMCLRGCTHNEITPSRAIVRFQMKILGSTNLQVWSRKAALVGLMVEGRVRHRQPWAHPLMSLSLPSAVDPTSPRVLFQFLGSAAKTQAVVRVAETQVVNE